MPLAPPPHSSHVCYAPPHHLPHTAHNPTPAAWCTSAAGAIRARLEQLQATSGGWFRLVQNSFGTFGRVEQPAATVPADIKARITQALPSLAK
jgi:hypothetical protein